VRDVSTSDPSTAAELATIADNVEQYRRRVGDLAERYVGTERDDVIAAIHEAERLLRSAERGLLRAVRAAR
jgi:cob(I)alamin adenosyltransferase